MFRLTLLFSCPLPPSPSLSPSPPPLYSNPDIHLLPLTLGRLRNCWELILHGLKISNVPQHLMPGVTRGGSTKHLLAYLRAQLRNCVPYNRMKLMLVGLQVRGRRGRGREEGGERGGVSLVPRPNPPTREGSGVTSLNPWACGSVEAL